MNQNPLVQKYEEIKALDHRNKAFTNSLNKDAERNHRKVVQSIKEVLLKEVKKGLNRNLPQLPQLLKDSEVVWVYSFTLSSSICSISFYYKKEGLHSSLGKMFLNYGHYLITGLYTLGSKKEEHKTIEPLINYIGSNLKDYLDKERKGIEQQQIKLHQTYDPNNGGVPVPFPKDEEKGSNFKRDYSTGEIID